VPAAGLDASGRAAACLALLAWNGEAYPAAHAGARYLADVRGDRRAAPKLVGFAEDDGCRTVEAVRVWLAAYLARFWTLSWRSGERGHRLADAVKVPQLCRPRGRPAVVPPCAPSAPADPAGFRRAAEVLASQGIEFAIAFSRRLGLPIAAAG